MSKNWKIREATIDDSAGLQSCMTSAYSSYQARFGSVRLPPLDADYSVEVKSFPSWVVEYDGEVVGGLIMTFERNYAVVLNIAVHPGFQDRGLGRELMKFAEVTTREKKLPELRLTTHILLTENVSLYRHLGWREIDRDETRVYMCKTI